MPRFLKILFFCSLFYACEHLPSVEQDKVIARAGSHYLYQSQLKEIISPKITLEDSTLLAQSIINTWAKKNENVGVNEKDERKHLRMRNFCAI